jgi:glyoxylase-like metal-dependent hydrolase (beta-lactamase superfamily II)
MKTKSLDMLSLLSMAVFGFGVLIAAATCHAAAPFHETQAPGFHRTKVGAFLVNTGKQLILVDTRAGGFWGGTAMGHLTQSLRASGYRPEQVDIVLLTHLHADHVAGLRNPDGTRKFPKATVSMLQADSDFWLSKEIASKAPPEAKEFFDLAQASAKPYQAVMPSLVSV